MAAPVVGDRDQLWHLGGRDHQEPADHEEDGRHDDRRAPSACPGAGPSRGRARRRTTRSASRTSPRCRARSARSDRVGTPPAPSAAGRTPTAGGRTGSTSPPERGRRSDTSTHWAMWPTSSCQKAGLFNARSPTRVEGVVEPNELPVVDRQKVVELGREVDRDPKPDDAHDDRTDEDGDLGDVAGHAVDEAADPAPARSTPSSDSSGMLSSRPAGLAAVVSPLRAVR